MAAYIQSVCSIVLLGLSSRYNNALRGTLVLTSLALVSSVAIFSLQVELSLPHAMVSLSLLTVVMLPLHFIESRRITSPGLFVAQQLRFGIYTAMEVWLVVKTPCLGSHPECNLCTKSVMLGHAYPTVNNLSRAARILATMVVGVIWLDTTIFTYGPRHYIEALPAMFSESRAAKWAAVIEHVMEEETAWRRFKLGRTRRRWAWCNPHRRKVPRWAGLLIKLSMWYEDSTLVSAIVDARRWSQAPTTTGAAPGWLWCVWSDLRLASAAPRFQRMVIALIFAAVCISNTEYAVHINVPGGANNWGFGQIFSMVGAVPFAASLIKFGLRLGMRDR